MARKDRRTLLTEMRLEQAQANRVRAVLGASHDEIAAKLAKLGSSGNPLTRMQLEAQRAAIRAVLDKDFADIGESIASGKIDAARAASKIVSEYEGVLQKIVMSDAAVRRIAAGEAQRTVNNLEAALKRIQGTSYNPLSKQVYKTKQMASGWIDGIIDKALVSGWSARQLADAVLPSISPKVPGGVSYAANRLARTEINNAYHAASYDRYLRSAIVQEVEWLLSSSHPEDDICNDYAAQSPFKKNAVPAKPHPNCYCYIVPRLPTEDEFIEKLFAGEYGDEPWANEVSEDMQPSSIFKGMSKGEENAVARYTRDSFKFNDDLRHGKKPEDTDLLDSAFQHASLERAMTVRRVVAGDPARDALSLTKNRAPRYTDPAFMSTQKATHGTLEELIDEFGQDRGAKVIFEIKLPKGAKAIDISGKLDDHPEALGYNQGEVLLPRDMQFKMGQPQTVGDWRDDITKIVLTPIWDTMPK
ncbi:capsid maturation protease [Microbacterium phage Krampus]|uniref:Capsid maturation protease n=2 Tax=Krampusvirus krampus TaxID=2734242 RepID=A0A2Z4Q333_9CAUD|nr:head morphogenesis [Microbacterium phage Krampus]AWY04470.1 capsid maturation protease [Microbacterium phage AnnaSerena]AWY05111.1 capsid maturation protease [Microbacterium phage Krampus]URP21680.1 capsid maturation protease [Microbacterium phage Kate]